MIDISTLRERSSFGAFTVTELNNYIKNIFDVDRVLSSVTVKGEISNFKYHSSGHLYFSLKDDGGQIKAVMFRSNASHLRFLPESGMRVIVTGSIGVYPRDGAYQIYVNSMQPDGIGALYLAYEQLKARLADEGLFDEEHKKAIPNIPERVGVITSPTGAAVQDIINVTGRRFPQARIYLYPVLVQGDGAEADLVRAVDYFDRSGLVDVVIIGRGGGSIEDLWAFNSEMLARRIFSAAVPIISAVGHETDFTICDFVSDMRAPTPSAAAEIAVPDIRDITMRLDSCLERSILGLKNVSRLARERLNALTERCNKDSFERFMALKKDAVNDLSDRATRHIEKLLSDKNHDLALKCEALNPLSVLTRGYAVVHKEKQSVSSVASLSEGDEITVRLADGSIDATITRVYTE